MCQSVIWQMRPLLFPDNEGRVISWLILGSSYLLVLKMGLEFAFF